MCVCPYWGMKQNISTNAAVTTKDAYRRKAAKETKEKKRKFQIEPNESLKSIHAKQRMI